MIELIMMSYFARQPLQFSNSFKVGQFFNGDIGHMRGKTC